MARPFVSYDGEGLEVWVSKGKGVIQELKEGEQGVSANLKIKVEGLKHAINCWVLVEDPLYAKIKEAHERKEEITYRVESQRKKDALEKEGLAPDTPIKELRKDMETAAQFTTPLLAAFNGELTSEAVSNPAKDPTPSGRVRDTSPVATESAAPAQNSRSQVVEEPPYRLYNSSGNLNLGSYAVAGTSSTESKVREYLVENEVVNPVDFGSEETEQKVFYLTAKLLEIADRVQVSVPHLNSKVDRNATSHTRARSVLYDSIKYAPKFTAESAQEWLSSLESLSVNRFQMIARLTYDGLTSLEEAEEVSSAPSAPTPQEPATEAAPVETEKGIEAIENAYVPSVEVRNDEEKASEETINLFKELVMEMAPNELNKVSRLLWLTFGSARAAEAPEKGLTQMVEHYAAYGEETFRNVLDKAWEQTER